MRRALSRRRVIFRVAGNDQVGMGHIYRALSLAQELAEHEVLFVVDTDSNLAADELARYDYWVGQYSPDKIIEKVLNLEPDLVINDVLDTSEQEILILKDTGIRVVNFEDLGSGAVCADLTINELYDVPKFEGNNVLWGRDYFFVRDEFLSAHPNKFYDTVSDVLLTFGGTDQHDLSRKIYRSIRSLCESQSINIHIVTGPGYRNYGELAAEVTGDDFVSLTHATGVISSIMEKVQLAITSNGRTVYELAHMNIPSIVISQHDRECTHAFAREENGVTPLDLYEENVTERKAIEEFEKLVFDVERRLKLYDKIKTISFSGNKRKVISIILGTLKS